MSDDVLELLDSLDTGRKDKPKTRKLVRPREKRANADIMDFLDDISKETTPSSVPPEAPSTPTPSVPSLAATPSTPAVNTPEPSSSVKPDENAAESVKNEERSTKLASSGVESKEASVDPIASISSWWSRNKEDIWDHATQAANAAKSHASGVVKQAEAKVNEMQKEQATSSFAFSSWQKSITSVLQTIVPPISHHEQLQINIFHDMVGYPNIDELVHEVFSRVMDQVEGGGDLNMVVQKGKERHLAQEDADRRAPNLNLFRGSVENGKKLAKANVEELIGAHDTSNDSNDPATEKNMIHHSELFLSIQPVVDSDSSQDDITLQNSGLFFVIYLTDPRHKIELTTASQTFPAKWAEWLDAAEDEPTKAADTRDWILEWVETGLQLAVGVVAQKYVFLRMGLDDKL